MEPSEVKKLQLKYDKEIQISTAITKTTKKWKNQTLLWSDFVSRLSSPTITQETAEDYKKLSKTRQDEIKDVGGFVGGWLKEGRRKRGYVQQRSLVTLDADSTTIDFWDNVQLLFDNAAAVYTTHSHLVKGPRYRLIIPLSRSVTAEEYEPIARKIAEIFGLDNFDDTTYQSERLMYFPSHSLDGQYFTDFIDAPFINPDDVLAEYTNWQDSSFWPESSRGHSIREAQAKRAGDPLEKKGLVGAFCRSYDIISSIETFLPDVYASTGRDDRWTYVLGSASGGLVIYDDKFAYSHHGTDPVGDQLVNAFDLVRIHKFGELDEENKANTSPTKMKSYRAMNDFLQSNSLVIEEMTKERLGEASNEFDEIQLNDDSVKTGWLSFDQGGNPDVNSYLLAKEVVSEVPFFYNGTEFLRYDRAKGIWVGGVDDFLRSYLTNAKLLKETRIRHLSETISAIKSLVYSESEFDDADVNQLVLTNGVYNILNNQFVERFDESLYARVAHPVEYDKSATCPTFDGFVKELVGEENTDFVYEWFGYNFYREYNLQKMLFIHGKAGTGKSTLVNLLKGLLGKENYSAVTLKNLMNERFAPSGLYRKLANFDTDAKPEYLADGSLLKQLTGEDTIYADRKNQDPIYFYNYAKLTFAMNELPAMRDFSGGLKRRLLILKVDKPLSNEVKKRFPIEAMKEEMPGIFNRSMEGLRKALKHGFTETSDMKENVNQWIKGNDVLSLFIEDECEIDPEYRAPSKFFYENYVIYCKQSGYKSLTRNNFVSRLREIGFENKQDRVDGKNTKCYFGIRQKEDIF